MPDLSTATAASMSACDRAVDLNGTGVAETGVPPGMASLGPGGVARVRHRRPLHTSVCPSAAPVHATVAAKQSSPTRTIAVPFGTADPAALKPEADAVTW